MAQDVDPALKVSPVDVGALDKLRVVLHTTKALADISDESDLLSFVAQSVCTHLGFGRCFVYVRDHDHAFRAQTSATLASTHPVEIPLEYSIPQPIFLLLKQAAVAIGNVLWIDGRSEITSDPRVAPYVIPTPSSVLAPEQWHDSSLLFAPLIGRNGEIVGLLGPDDPLDGKLPSPESALVLETFAHLCSVALELVRARSNAAAQARILEAQRLQVARLFAASTAVTREIQLDNMMTTIARTMAEAGGFARVALLLLDHSGTKLKLVATYGISESGIAHLTNEPLDLSDFAPMMQPEMLISRSYFYDHNRFQISEDQIAIFSVPDSTRAWEPGLWHRFDSLNIPLYDENRNLLGIISVDEPINGRIPETYHIEALEFFADQCATAVSQVVAHRVLEVKAETDALTRLPNRTTFGTRMISSIQHCVTNQLAVSLLFMDLDHFKEVNDGYGHLVGDIVLRSVARGLRSSIRKMDLLARFGGEEFVLLLPDTDLNTALSTAEKLRKRIEDTPVRISDAVKLQTTISIGVANTTQVEFIQSMGANDVSNQLLTMADIALYNAKGNGRNQVSSNTRKTRANHESAHLHYLPNITQYPRPWDD